MRASILTFFAVGHDAPPPGEQGEWENWWLAFTTERYSFLHTDVPWCSLYTEHYLK